MCGDVSAQDAVCRFIRVALTWLITLHVAAIVSLPVSHTAAAAPGNQTGSATNCSFPGEGAAARLIALSPDRNLSLVSPGNATNFTALSYALNDTLQYACLPGHWLASGSLWLTCTDAGHWDTAAPECVGDDEGASISAYVVEALIALIALVLLIVLPIDFIKYRRKKRRMREYLKRGRRATNNKVRPQPFHVKQKTSANPAFAGIWTTHQLVVDGQLNHSTTTDNDGLRHQLSHHLDYSMIENGMSDLLQNEKEADSARYKEKRKKNRFVSLKTMKSKKRRVTPFVENDDLSDECDPETEEGDIDVKQTPRVQHRSLPPLNKNNKDELLFNQMRYDDHSHLPRIKPMEPIRARPYDNDSLTTNSGNVFSIENHSEGRSLSHFNNMENETESRHKTKKKHRDKEQRKSRVNKNMKEHDDSFFKRSAGLKDHDSWLRNGEHSDKSNSKSSERNLQGDISDQTNRTMAQTPRGIPAMKKELTSYINRSFNDDYDPHFSDDGGYSNDHNDIFDQSSRGMHI